MTIITILIPLLLVIAVTAFHAQVLLFRDYAAIVSASPVYDAYVLKYENGEAVMQFRIEEEKKTVIQKCAVCREYKRGDYIRVYFSEDGTEVRAVTESDSPYEHYFRIAGVISLAAFVSAVMILAVLIIL